MGLASNTLELQNESWIRTPNGMEHWNFAHGTALLTKCVVQTDTAQKTNGTIHAPRPFVDARAISISFFSSEEIRSWQLKNKKRLDYNSKRTPRIENKNGHCLLLVNGQKQVEKSFSNGKMNCFPWTVFTIDCGCFNRVDNRISSSVSAPETPARHKRLRNSKRIRQIVDYTQKWAQRAKKRLVAMFRKDRTAFANNYSPRPSQPNLKTSLVASSRETGYASLLWEPNQSNALDHKSSGNSWLYFNILCNWNQSEVTHTCKVTFHLDAAMSYDYDERGLEMCYTVHAAEVDYLHTRFRKWNNARRW